MYKDIYLSDTGAFVIESGDFMIAQDEDCDRAMANVRLKTTNPDMYLQRSIGADLPLLVGEQNTVETSSTGESQILSALKRDSRFSYSSIDIASYIPDFNTSQFRIWIESSRTLADAEPLTAVISLRGI